jgi:hypothetical protein
MRLWLLVGSVFLVLAAPAAAAQPAWKGLINDWFDNGIVDHPWPCSAYRAALKALPNESDTYSTAKADLARNLRQRRCTTQTTIHPAAVEFGPKADTQAQRWPYIAGAAAALLLSATALGLLRARRSTPV